MTPCVECGSPAKVFAQWSTSGGPQEGEFCSPCMADVWKVFKSSTVFNFQPVEQEP